MGMFLGFWKYSKRFYTLTSTLAARARNGKIGDAPEMAGCSLSSLSLGCLPIGGLGVLAHTPHGSGEQLVFLVDRLLGIVS